MDLRTKKNRNTILVLTTASLLALALAGCAEDEIVHDTEVAATAPTPAPAATTDPVPAVATPEKNTVVEARLAEMQDRLQGMEQKVTDLQAQLQLAQNRAPVAATGALPIAAHPAQNAGRDPEAGFTQDEIVQAYRKAMVLFQAQKFSESILAFSAFVEQNPDHVLAGSAQFYLGQAYFEQKEYKLALKEWERVITSYDRSPRVSDTLRQMAQAEDQLKRPKEAATHRQLLSSLFPQSPAARLAMRDSVAPQIQLTTDAAAENAAAAQNSVPATPSSMNSTGESPARVPDAVPEAMPAQPTVPTTGEIPPPETAPAIE